MQKSVIYRVADQYGRQIGCTYTQFIEALKARADGLLVEIYDRKTAKWVEAKCLIRIENQGQHFATIGHIVDPAGELVASTHPVAAGFTEAAELKARDLAQQLGLKLVRQVERH